jgi:hypothetical protein
LFVQIAELRCHEDDDVAQQLALCVPNVMTVATPPPLPARRALPAQRNHSSPKMDAYAPDGSSLDGHIGHIRIGIGFVRSALDIAPHARVVVAEMLVKQLGALVEELPPG